jgi:CheY-like chemotaxis protein/anti-sigma regulatory factor (Ser/Thr protein kinase)
LRDQGLIAGLTWLAEYMKKYNQTVTVHVPTQHESELPEAHRILLFQSVRELLINSSKHAGTGRATVRLTPFDDRIVIAVSDEGRGFDLAAAAAAGTSTGGISSKFGLFSIQERMKAMGGDFDIRSSVGKGTTATLTLPPEKRTVECGQWASSHRQIRVLLVDDHSMMRQGLRSALDAYDDLHVVAEAPDGAEAVHLVQDLRPRVVVMDVNMPRMNGIDATARIKTQWPETMVIGISVNAQDENSAAMKRAGATTVLPKESALDQLHEAIVQGVGASADQ